MLSHDNKNKALLPEWSSSALSPLLCGLLAGVAQAGLFNPYDRALYLSVRDERPFLHAGNWTHPYLGFVQSLNTRALAGGLYFPLEHLALQLVPPQQHFAAGMIAGTINALLLNPLTAVKYQTWGRTENRGVWTEALCMARAGSWRPFVKGLGPTILRDTAFGGTYTVLRLHIVQQQQQHNDHNGDDHQQGGRRQVNTAAANFVAAALATVVSGPFNYVRNVQYGTPSGERAPTVPQVLIGLFRETMAVGQQVVAVVEMPQSSGQSSTGSSTSGGGAMRMPPQQPRLLLLLRLHFVQTKLRIGWGTARVAMGMSFSHAVYDWLHGRMMAG
jgi:hypothetical protein